MGFIPNAAKGVTRPIAEIVQSDRSFVGHRMGEGRGDRFFGGPPFMLGQRGPAFFYADPQKGVRGVLSIREFRKGLPLIITVRGSP